MATELFAANRAATTVTSGGTTAPAGGTQQTWTVTSSAMFGAAAAGVSQFHVADPASPSEIIAVTNVSGTTWTVTRGAESTTPVAHSAGFTVYQVGTAGFLGSVLQATAGSASVPLVMVPPPSNDTSGATDQAAIQALENAAASAGALLVFAPGTYWVTGLTKQSNTIWQGAGRQVTTIKLTAGANADVAEGANFSALTGTGSLGGITAWSLRDLTIDGNRSAQSGASWGLRVYGYDFSLYNVSITNCFSDGMWTEWAYAGSPAYGGSTPDSMESLYVGVKSCFNGGWGWHNRGPHDSVAVGCDLFLNNQAGGTAGNLWVEDDRSSQHYLGSGLQCSGCHTWGNTAAWGVIFDAAVIWAGGQMEGAINGALLVRGQIHLSGSKVYYNSVASISQGAGIQLGDDGSTPGVPSSFSFTSSEVRIAGTGLDNFAARRSSAAVAWVNCNHSSVDVHCNPQVPTIASGSNGQTINALTSSQLLVGTTTGWPASGTIYVQTSAGYAKCTYTSVTGGGTPSFNGVTYVSGSGGTATVATGGIVAGDPLGGTSPDQYSTVRVDQGTGTSSGIRGALSPQQAPGPVKILTGSGTAEWQIQNAASAALVNLDTSGATPLWAFVGSIVQGWTANFGKLTLKLDPTTGAVIPGTAAGGAGCHIWSGSGAPNISGSGQGDIYFRTDTAGTANQRIYIATASNTWSGIV